METLFKRTVSFSALRGNQFDSLILYLKVYLDITKLMSERKKVPNVLCHDFEYMILYF